MSETGAVSYRLNGRVGFDNLMELREQGEAAIRDGGDRAVIDLSGLENGNSAAVALLMAWFRLAENLGKEIVFQAPPAEIENIVGLSGLSALLPLGNPGEATT